MGSAQNIKNVASIVKNHKINNKSVVVSAMSGITDVLITMGKQAIAGNTAEVRELIKFVEEKHVATLSELVSSSPLLEKGKHFIHTRLEELEEFLKAIAIIKEISPRSHDAIVAVGEVLSAWLLSLHMQDQNTDAEFVNLESILEVDDNTSQKVFFEMLKIALKNRISPILERGGTPIITGFFGKIPGGIVGAVGRGYSDFTAALVGYSCDAKEIEIWTDVSGILSADPRIVPNAVILDEISFEEASELATYGAKVIHPQTIWPAVKNNILVRIKNTMKPEDIGTAITAEGKMCPYACKSVTAKKNITMLTMKSFEMQGHGFMAKIFQKFGNHEVSVDLIATSEASVTVTIDSGHAYLDTLLSELKTFCDVEVEANKAIVAIIGREMQYKTGVAGKMFGALGTAGVNIRLISQGAPEINISAVINEEDSPKAIKAIHEAFFTNN